MRSPLISRAAHRFGSEATSLARAHSGERSSAPALPIAHAKGYDFQRTASRAFSYAGRLQSTAAQINVARKCADCEEHEAQAAAGQSQAEHHCSHCEQEQANRQVSEIAARSAMDAPAPAEPPKPVDESNAPPAPGAADPQAAGGQNGPQIPGCDPTIQSCNLEVAPPSPGPQPAGVSQALIDRLMGKYASVDGDPGEGCREKPYVAAPGEDVCTIGFGHQLRNDPYCPITDASGTPVTNQSERVEMYKKNPSSLKCGCDISFNCKGKQAEDKLRADAKRAAAAVKATLNVELNQAEFDALADLVLARGSLTNDLIAAINLYWGSPQGKDYVRSIYLRTAVSTQGSSQVVQGHVDRRRRRGWKAYLQENQ